MKRIWKTQHLKRHRFKIPMFRVDGSFTYFSDFFSNEDKLVEDNLLGLFVSHFSSDLFYIWLICWFIKGFLNDFAICHIDFPDLYNSKEWVSNMVEVFITYEEGVYNSPEDSKNGTSDDERVGNCGFEEGGHCCAHAIYKKKGCIPCYLIMIY